MHEHSGSDLLVQTTLVKLKKTADMPTSLLSPCPLGVTRSSTNISSVIVPPCRQRVDLLGLNLFLFPLIHHYGVSIWNVMLSVILMRHYGRALHLHSLCVVDVLYTSPSHSGNYISRHHILSLHARFKCERCILHFSFSSHKSCEYCPFVLLLLWLIHCTKFN